MSTATSRAIAPAAISAGANPWAITILVAFASFMEVLDTTVANVALPYIAGGMGVSEDEASWVVTTYLVSNAVILTASPFFARLLGRRTFFLTCLGGWLSDNFSWQWCFLINGPVGVVATALVSMVLRESKATIEERRRSKNRTNNFDVGGFVLVATFLGALEIVLDRGLIDDWFASSFIVGVAVASGLAFALMIPWELGRRDPMIDIRIVASRQFAASLFIMLALGAILLTTTQVLPQLVQQNFGYTATWAGLVLSPGGLVTMVMMPVAGRLSAKVQPRYLIAVGATFCALSMYDMTRLTGDLDFWFFAVARVLMNVGIPLIFVPITVAAYDGIPHAKTDQASAIINAARNVGGSLGISLANNVLAHREQFHQTRLAEHAIPSGIPYQNALQQLTQYFVAQGSSLLQAQQQAVAWIGQKVQTQASISPTSTCFGH